jgi:hypothetical protein
MGGFYVINRTEKKWRGAYPARMDNVQKTQPPAFPDDFRLSIAAENGMTYTESNVLLARALCSGALEFMTSAWERLLGYAGPEFAGKTLCQFMRLEKPIAIAVIASILDERDSAPVLLTLHCRNGHAKRLRLHRRFDPDERAVYLLAEEMRDHHPHGRPGAS